MWSLRSLIVLVALLPVIVLGEPPVQYGVPAPSIGLSGGYFGHSSSGGGGSSQSYEGLNVDPQLLHKIKSILVDHEIQEDLHRSHHGHGSSLSPVYGVPSYDSGRVTGIELGGIRPSIQVAQFHKLAHEYSSSGHGGYSSGYSGSSGHGGYSTYSGNGGYSGSSGHGQLFTPALTYGAPAPAPRPISIPVRIYSAPSAPSYLTPPRPQLAYGAPLINPRHNSHY